MPWHGLDLIVVLRNAELLPDFREFAELGHEFIDVEVGYHEVFIDKGRRFGLSAKADHGVHVFGVGIDITNVEIDPLGIEK